MLPGRAQTTRNPFLQGTNDHKIGMAFTYIAMSSCQEPAGALQRCAALHKIAPEDDQGILRKCKKEVESVNTCFESVNHDEVWENLTAISAQSCPDEFARFKACSDHNEGDPSPCSYEFIRTLACGSSAILGSLQRPS
jgi:hypothetical protein